MSTNKFTIGSQNVNPKSAFETTVLDPGTRSCKKMNGKNKARYGFEVQEFTPTH